MGEGLATNNAPMENNVLGSNAFVVTNKSHVAKSESSIIIIRVPFVKGLTAVVFG